MKTLLDILNLFAAEHLWADDEKLCTVG